MEYDEKTVMDSIEAARFILEDAYEIDNEEYIDYAKELIERQERILKKWREINGKK